MLVIYAAIALFYSFLFLSGWGLLPLSQLRFGIFPAIGLLLLASTIMDIRAVTLALLLAMVLVIWGTSEVTGIFSGREHSALFWMVLEQSFACVFSVATIALAALIREKDARNVDVLRLNDLLSTRVNYRTNESAAAIDRADDNTRQKLRFVEHVRDEVREPLANLLAMCNRRQASEPVPPSLLPRVAGTLELLLTVLDDLVSIGYAESGRLCSENIKFDPVTLFREALSRAAPDAVPSTTWQVSPVPHYVDGDRTKLRRCLVAMITSVRRSEALHSPTFFCAVGPQEEHSPLPGRVRLRFEVRASEEDVEPGWEHVTCNGESSMTDRAAALAEELGGELCRAHGGLHARLVVPLRRALSQSSLGSSARFREAKTEAILRQNLTVLPLTERLGTLEEGRNPY